MYQRIRRSKLTLWGGALLFAVFMYACGDTEPDGTPDTGTAEDVEQPSPDASDDVLRIEINSDLEPWTGSVPGYEDGDQRPIARSVYNDDLPADFVENEVILATDAPDQLDAFLETWNGTVLKTIDPETSGLDTESRYIVRLDTSEVDSSILEATLADLSPRATGTLTFSSESGRRLVAAAASAANQGLKVDLNWMAYGMQGGETFNDRISEEHQPSPRRTAPNAFDFDYFTTASPQNTGVAEAWLALERADKLTNKVGIAIIDGGFSPNDDFPSTHVARATTGSATGDVNPTPCSGGSSCPWHGTGALGAAMGVADNRFGGAGPGGPVAEAYTVHTALDHGDIMDGVNKVVNDVFVISMSFGGTYSGSWAWWALDDSGDFFLATWRKDKFLLAAAGNGRGSPAQGFDVDNGETRGDDPEIQWPCEFSGVTCIGALANNSNQRIGYSNFGGTNVSSEIYSYGTVDMFAPTNIDVARPSSNFGSYGGTSAATPFVAGVVALMKAADPSLSAQGAWRILRRTANTGSSDAAVDRWVDAKAAVLDVLVQSNPPYLTIESPEPGDSVAEGEDLIFKASVDDIDTPLGDYDIRWYYLDGPTQYILGTTKPDQPMTKNPMCDGSYTLWAEAYTSLSGEHTNRGQASVEMTVNDPTGDPPSQCAPSVTIVAPSEGDIFRVGDIIDLAATFEDDDDSTDDPIYPIIWRAGDENGRILGTTVNGSAKFGEGTHTIYVEYGSASDQVGIEVEQTPNQSPTATITDPADGDYFVDYSMGLAYDVEVTGEATDPEDGQLTGSSLQWSYRRAGTPNWTDAGTGRSTTMSLRDWECRFTTYEVRLRATDTGGLNNADIITVHIDSLGC